MDKNIDKSTNNIVNNGIPEKKSTYKPILVEEIPLSLTFDDILMVPRHSDVGSRFDVSLKSRFSKNIPLNIPLVSSPMDTVTEDQMAIHMARNGGLGVIHRFQSIQDQVEMVEKVLRSESYIIKDPVTIPPNTIVADVNEMKKQYGINTFIVSEEKTNSGDSLSSPSKRKNSRNNDNPPILGLLTNRDLLTAKTSGDLVKDLMTPIDRLVTVNVGSRGSESYPSVHSLIEIMHANKIEKIPLIRDNNILVGLCTLKDLKLIDERPIANKTSSGTLYVAASVGAKDDFLERGLALKKAGCPGIVVDIANGHSKLCIETVETLKDNLPGVDIIAGSIASGEGAEKLIRAGADSIRCGIGNGSICITRIVSGAGVPQFSAICDVAPVCKEYDIPLISDGGNKNSGNMCKALAAGADCIMLGRLVAGCEESPSKIIYKDGRLSKVYRGMAGLGANISKSQRISGSEAVSANFNAEGVEGYIPYAGPLKDVLLQFANGIRSGLSYSGAFNITQLQQNVKFIRITNSGKVESGVHDIKQFS